MYKKINPNWKKTSFYFKEKRLKAIHKNTRKASLKGAFYGVEFQIINDYD